MPQPKSGCRFGHGRPAGRSIAKSADFLKLVATQHSPEHSWQSAASTGSRRTVQRQRVMTGRGAEREAAKAPQTIEPAQASGQSRNQKSPNTRNPPMNSTPSMISAPETVE